MIQKSDITYTYDSFGYMLHYKGVNIGGAGTLGREKRVTSNLKFYKDQAEVEKRNILQGRLGRFRKIIKEIDEKTGVN